jgi:hypothetical protein
MKKYEEQPKESHFGTPERLGQQATHRPAGLDSTNPQDNKHNSHQHDVQQRVSSAL